VNQTDRFVLIRVAGRGDWRIYHPLAGDDVSPLCGSAIVADQWDAIAEEQARRASRNGPARRCCRHCKAKEANRGVSNP